MSQTTSGVIPGAYAGQRTSDGVPSNGTASVWTITTGGTPDENAGVSFSRFFYGGVKADADFDTTNATLIANYQTAMDTLFGSGNTLVAVGTMTAGVGTATVTFQGSWANLAVSGLTVESHLTGTSPTVAVAETTAGVTATHRGCPPGTTVTDQTNGDIYINQGTAYVPDYSKVGTV